MPYSVRGSRHGGDGNQPGSKKRKKTAKKSDSSVRNGSQGGPMRSVVVQTNLRVRGQEQRYNKLGNAFFLAYAPTGWAGSPDARAQKQGRKQYPAYCTPGQQAEKVMQN